jgi:hypothetical protein
MRKKVIRDIIVLVVNWGLIAFFLIWNYKGKKMFSQIPGIPPIHGTKPEERIY